MAMHLDSFFHKEVGALTSPGFLHLNLHSGVGGARQFV